MPPLRNRTRNLPAHHSQVPCPRKGPRPPAERNLLPRARLHDMDRTRPHTSLRQINHMHKDRLSPGYDPGTLPFCPPLPPNPGMNRAGPKELIYIFLFFKIAVRVENFLTYIVPCTKPADGKVVFAWYFPYILFPRRTIGEWFLALSSFSHSGGIRKWFLLLFVLIYRFCSFHSLRYTKLLVPNNNERMIKKEKREKKKAGDLGREPSPLFTRGLNSEHQES